jgi:hypothetical protein
MAIGLLSDLSVFLCDFDGGIGGFFVTYYFIFGKHVFFKIGPR